MCTLHIPRIIISALRGGGGKTLLALGLCRAMTGLEKGVKPYKKGPDYIDAHWLELAAQNPCTNVDPYFLHSESLQSLFVHAFQSKNHDVAIIEGNRGLFDGQDVQGSCSTAELSRILQAPVLLSLDITKMTRTSAALLQGMAHFEKDVRIGGVVLNQVGSTRHESIVRGAIEYYTDIPVLGALPRLKENPLPERHMGLCQSNTKQAHDMLDTLGTFVSNYCDLNAIWALARSAAPLPAVAPFWPKPVTTRTKPIRIAYIYDEAFWFYYAENLEALRREGAELIPVSLLSEKAWPKDIHGLYLGGGYPEEYLDQLSVSAHLPRIKSLSEQGLPIYAECGGFMILAENIVRQGKHFSMSGVFPVQSEFHPRPQGLGYVKGKITQENPYHPLGQELRGHEFHYSKCVVNEDVTEKLSLCMQLDKGTGMGTVDMKNEQHADGLLVRQTFASYTHIFAPTCPWWAPNFVELAAQYAHERRT